MAEVSATDGKYNSANGGLFTGATGKGSNLDKDSFLLLLVTQFQHQDPLNPMDDKEFVAQLAQFSALEQSMTMNETMNKLLDAQLLQQTMGAVNYIGKEVLARGYGVSVRDDSVSNVQYALPVEVVKGYINILDDSVPPQLVTTVDLPSKGSGVHSFEWDGTKTDGSRVANGVYTIQISATDANGQGVLVDTQVGGKVSGISTYNGEQYLTLDDGRVVALKNVREVLEFNKTEDPKDPEDPEDPEDPKDPVEPEKPAHPIVDPKDDASAEDTAAGDTGTTT